MKRKKNKKFVENTRPMFAEENKIIFQKLTPTSEIDLSVYEDAINYIFDNSDVTNVALSGPYSAGKSSVLEAYKKNTDKKFMHISLAHFEQLNGGDKNKIKESVLEGKILNQLIHQIPVDLIPQTNFRIKKDNGNKNIYKITTLISLIFISAFYMLKFGKMRDFVNSIGNKNVKFMLSGLINDYVILLAGLAFIICSVIGIYNIVKVQKEKNLFHKISLNGNEIEIFEKQEDSYFDKYLNEVLYLFEKADADVIVFEDMDRFNANSIFERLREINHLVNVRRKSRSNNLDNYEPLRFLYLLRDDIFVTKDRTKFFDYIVPIVPVLDGSNSHEQFVKFFKEAEVIDKFDESFLQRLSLYIDCC